MKRAHNNVAGERRVRRERLNRRLVGYAATAGAALAVAGTANADIIVNAGFPGAITVNVSNPLVGFDLTGGGTSHGSVKLAAVGINAYTFGNSLRMVGPGTPGVLQQGGSARAKNLAPGYVIGPGRSFVGTTPHILAAQFGNPSYYPVRTGNFLGTRGFIGVTFTDPSKPAQTDYGWIDFGANDDSTVGTIYGWAYDDSGAAIGAGQTVAVPEPTSLALLALGALSAAGVGVLRRWKKEA